MKPSRLRTSKTRPRARQERFDAEFAKAVKGAGIEPRAWERTATAEERLAKVAVLREVEELMLERGVIVSYETIRRWCLKFGQSYANMSGLR